MLTSTYLVQLEEGEIGLKVVSVTVVGLHLNVTLQRGDVVRVVPLDAPQHPTDLGSHHVHRRHRHLRLLFLTL